MKNLNKIQAFHLGLLLVLLIAGGYGYYKYWNIALVNGKGISRIEYIKTMERVGGKQTLDQMIQDNLILEEGRKNKITMNKAEIETETKKVEERLKAQGQTLDSALALSGMTRADLERQMLMQKIQNTLVKVSTPVTQAQIDEFIKTYKTQLPAKATKAELETIAKDELNAQEQKVAVTDWLTNLTKNAKVVLK